MRHVFEGVEILVFGGDFDATAPATGAVEVQAAGVRNLGAIDEELIIVETFVLRLGDADPCAFIALG
jgi:hypothetical protein